jgi:hypothetical protein
MISKAQIFEQAIRDFGIEAALEYFNVKEDDKQFFRNTLFEHETESPSIEQVKEELKVGDYCTIGKLYRIEGDNYFVWDRTDGMSLCAAKSECIKCNPYPMNFPHVTAESPVAGESDAVEILRGYDLFKENYVLIDREPNRYVIRKPTKANETTIYNDEDIRQLFLNSKPSTNA